MTIIECAEYLREKDNYLILTHSRPDGDTLGSASALCRALRAFGKTAYLYENPQITSKHLSYTSDLFAPQSFKADCRIAVDIADVGLLPLGFLGRADLGIDHHASNTHYIENMLLLSGKASCGEIVFILIKQLGVEIDKTIADALYVAVSTDTGCFQYANTTSETLRAAAELFDLGADTVKLNKMYFRTSSEARLKLEGEIFSTLRSLHGGKVSIAVITLQMLEECGVTEDDCEDLAALSGRMEGAVVSVTVRQIAKSNCRISVRSMPEFNANKICQRFGGGGHAMAAGCNIFASPEVAVQMLLKEIEECWE